MNCIAPLSTTSCASCGAVKRLSETVYDSATGENVCEPCWADSQARAALQLAKERADQFQWLSGEWFRTAYQCRMPFNSRSERYYRRAS